jgi:hypothetical protein
MQQMHQQSRHQQSILPFGSASASEFGNFLFEYFFKLIIKISSDRKRGKYFTKIFILKPHKLNESFVIVIKRG